MAKPKWFRIELSVIVSDDTTEDDFEAQVKESLDPAGNRLIVVHDVYEEKETD